jgi:hypothetical protein
MSIRERRCPETILEYFEVLKWKNSECRGKTSAEIIDSSRQELKSVEEELDKIQNLVTENSRFILSAQKEVDSIRSTIFTAEENLISIREEILEIRKRKSEHRQKSPKTRNFEQFDTSEKINRPMFDLKKLFVQLIIGICKDIRLICLDAWQAIITLDVLVLLQYFSVSMIAVILSLQSGYLVNVIFCVLILSYISWKVFNLFRKHKENWTYKSMKRETIQQRNVQQEQTFESYLGSLEQRKAVQEECLAQQKFTEKELVAQIRQNDSDLISLTHRRDRLIDQCQHKCSEMEKQRSKLERLLYLDSLTEEWLEKSIDILTSKAQKKLNLYNSEYFGMSGALKVTPIRALNGFTSRTRPSFLVEDDVEERLKSDEILGRYINKEDAKSQYDYHAKRRRYGVYEFTVIFLCQNFLSYYKCYYNFIRGKSVNEEYCEYLYDSIVFTKVQERSSLKMQDLGQKQIYSKCLIIATNDGKVMRLRIDKSRGEKKLSSKLSEIDTAATEIRTMLRQRELS